MSDTWIAELAVLVFSVVLHEIGHGWAAMKLGDDTARRAGRLTLNPLPHIDFFYTLLMPALLLHFFGFAFGGAKPVPVNPYNFTVVSPRCGMMLVAIAGPAVNLILAGVGLVFLHMFKDVLLPEMVTETLSFIFELNVILMAFNMLPVPPLDGSKVLMGLISREAALQMMRLEPYGMMILLGMFYFGLLDKVMGGLSDWTRSLLP